MVNIEKNGDEIRLVLRPNRSFSWRANQQLFLFIVVWLVSFALIFAAMGAWVILPFVGVELLVLAGALYYISWKVCHCEVLHITRDQVCIAKGTTPSKTSHPKASWTLPRDDVVVHVAAAPHPWGAPTIQFTAKYPDTVRVGEFLNQQDCKQLLQQLVSARLTTRHSAGRVSAAF
jgi:uncharacterized membrane protein